MFGRDTGKQKTLRRLVEQADYDAIAHELEADLDLVIELAELLEDPSSDVVDTANRAIWNLGRGDDFSVPYPFRKIGPRLMALLDHRSSVTRVNALQLIAEFSGRGEWDDCEEFTRPFAPRLVELLRDPDTEVRRLATEAIQGIAERIEGGSGNFDVLRDAVPVLRGLLRDETSSVSATWALRAIGHTQPAWVLDSIPDLVELFPHANQSANAMASALLRYLAEYDSERASAAEPLLRKLLSYPWKAVQENAALAMGFLGAETEDGTVRRFITELLEDKRESHREAAARVLGRRTGGASG